MLNKVFFFYKNKKKYNKKFYIKGITYQKKPPNTMAQCLQCKVIFFFFKKYLKKIF